MHRILLLVALLSPLLTACSKETQMQTADDVFCSELEKRGISYSLNSEGLYLVQVRGQSVTVSLENIRRNYDRDADASAIVRFIDTVESISYGETPAWEDVRGRVRYCLEPSDYATGFDGVLYNVISDELNQVFVHVSEDGTRISWINVSMLDDWGIRREQLVQQAEQNMAAIVAQAKLEVQIINGNELGWIDTKETSFKASFILTGAFKDLVSPKFDWPVYVVVPSRDFAYIVRGDNDAFLGHLGGVVIDEFRNSSYPITKDVLRVSDDGIKAIGTYPEPE